MYSRVLKCFICPQLPLPNHGRVGWNAALCDDSAQVSGPCVDSWSMITRINWLFIPRVTGGLSAGSTVWSASAWEQERTSSPALQWVRTRTKASTLSYFSIFLPVFFIHLSVSPVIIEGFQATQLITLNIKASHQAHTGQQVSLQSAAYAAILQLMNHLGDSLF